MTTRRALLAAGVLIPLSPGRPRARISLPAPTGPYRIGTVSRYLADRSLMVSVWYPATRDAARYPVFPWMPAAPLRELLASAGFPPDATPSPLTAGREGAPVLRSLGRLPVILYSHGAGGHRSEATIVVQELASHGYAVITVDHTGDAYTEFPSGRLSVPSEDVPTTPWDHANDILFLLDRLAHLPVDLDLHRIGMFGWSKGATATALVMNSDRRVRAGLSFDGPMESVPRPTDIDRPFMLLTAEFFGAAVAEFWPHLRGWRRNLHTEGAPHSGYIDHQWLIPQLARILGMGDAELESWIGTLSPARAVRIQQSYPLAFFDLHLRHRGHLLDGLPEVGRIP